MFMRTCVSFFFLLIFGNSAFAQSEIGEICNWDYNKKAAVALTFDDWLTTHPTIVVPALQERNMVGTFYCIAKDLNATKIAQLSAAIELGNEIGNHSYTHSSIDSIIAVEARPSKEKLDEALTSQCALTYDYPYGTFSNTTIDSVRNAGHIAARGVWPPSSYRYNFATSDNDYYNLRTIGVGSANGASGLTTTKEFASYLTKVIKGGGFITYLYHGVGKSSDWANIPADSLYAQLDTLQSLENDIWVTTVANAILYHREARCASITKISADEEDAESIEITLSDTLDDAVYKHPLTIKVYNNGKTFSEIKQAEEDCPILAQTAEYILFRAVPDQGTISLKYGDWDISPISTIDMTTAVKVSGREISVTTENDADISLYSSMGTMITSQKGSLSYTIPTSGVYIVIIDGISQKVIVR